MTLYPYQQRGVDFLLGGERRYLADGMGLGKTVQTLAALRQREVRNVLVLCPASARDNWHDQYHEWLGAGAFRTLGIESYASRPLRTESLRASDWDALVLDEAHYLKNHRAQRTRRALRLAKGVPVVYPLSGTPMPNHPGELWPIFNALWPESMAPNVRTHARWFRHFCVFVNTRYGPRVVGVRNGAELRAMLADVMLRRQLEDVGIQLPPLRVTMHMLPNDSTFTAALEEAGVDSRALVERIEAEEDLDEASMSRLRRLGGLYKAPRIARILEEELDDHQYHKIVVMYHHREVGQLLREKLGLFGVVGIDGSSSRTQRREAVESFVHGTPRVFVAQQQSAGEALNLQVATELVLVEPAWSPDANRQAIKRIHRIGSEHPCRARVFGVAGTLDAAVMRTVARKSQMQDTVGL